LSPRLRPLLRTCALLVLGIGLALTASSAQAAVPGTVVAWGCAASNDWGQCSVPGSLAGHITAIDAGDSSHSLALKDDGTVVAWGCGSGSDFGQCSVPGGLSGVTAISAGFDHNLALKNDGTVTSWGCGFIDVGQCGVPGGLGGVTAVSAGNFHSLALKDDGTVIAWGCGSFADYGQCDVPGSLSGVTAIAAGHAQSLALKNDGTVVAWGCGGGQDTGQCSVPSGLSGVTAIAAGSFHSLALKDDGTVIAWGCGSFADYGQCDVPASLSGVTAIAAGYSHSLALKNDGTVIAWGCGGGQDTGQCSVPNGLANVTAIAAGNAHNLALAVLTGQTISFGALPGKIYGDPDFAVSATASSGLPVSFAAGGTCTVSGSTVHLTGAGSCTVTASQPGSVIYNPAPDVPQSFTIAKAKQTISFGPLADRTYPGPDFAISATASSGLAVSFAASGTCTVSGATVHLTGAGSCTVTASQSGNANYRPAANVSRTFAIAKLGQTITFDPLADKTYGDPDFRVTASASSGLPVSFTASGRCTIKVATVHLTGAGLCTVTASQPGDAYYSPAPAVSRSFSIRRPPCRVPKVVGRRLRAAKKLIAKRHCRTGKVGYAYSRKRKKGIVISQGRRPGRVLPACSKINLVVSRGRKH
jgi:alpha-tubulin suppressor-like RCC1 family protein